MTLIRTCPRCEKACSLQIDHQGQEIFSIRGHRCPVGVEFAQSLFGPPPKTVTASVRVKGGVYPSVPARTSRQVAADLVTKILHEANRLEVEAPVRVGQVLARNIAHSGADLIAARAVSRA